MSWNWDTLNIDEDLFGGDYAGVYSLSFDARLMNNNEVVISYTDGELGYSEDIALGILEVVADIDKWSSKIEGAISDLVGMWEERVRKV